MTAETCPHQPGDLLTSHPLVSLVSAGIIPRQVYHTIPRVSSWPSALVTLSSSWLDSSPCICCFLFTSSPPSSPTGIYGTYQINLCSNSFTERGVERMGPPHRRMPWQGVLWQPRVQPSLISTSGPGSLAAIKSRLLHEFHLLVVRTFKISSLSNFAMTLLVTRVTDCFIHTHSHLC